MKRTLVFICILFTVCISTNAFDATSYALGSMMKASSNKTGGGCAHTGPLHMDTSKIEFTRKDKPNAKVLVFTYHKCNMVYHGNLWYSDKNGRLWLQRDYVFLESDPAKMSIEELRKAL